MTDKGEGLSKGINTGESSRDTLGVGGIINPKHEGGLINRRVENALDRRMDQANSNLPPKIERRVRLADDGGKLYYVGNKLVTKEEWDAAGL